MDRPALKPTVADLLAAYNRCFKRTWPASFDAAMAHPLYSRLVHMNALGQLLADARTSKRAQLATAQALPWPARRGCASAQPAARPWPNTTPDRKRLAAGDTDDDE